MSKRATIDLESNDLLTGESGQGLCTAGAFIFGAGGERFVVTALDAFRGERARTAFSVKTRTRIGYLTNSRDGGHKALPFWKAIGLIRLDDNVAPAVSRASQNEYPVLAWNVDRLIDREAHVLGRPELSGVVHATYGEINLASRFDDKLVTYEETVEIHARQSTKLKLRRGDGGSLVVARQHHAIGIMIGAKGKVWFIAPLLPLLERRGLSLIPPSTDRQCKNFPNAITALAAIDRASLLEEPTLNLGPIPTASYTSAVG